MPQINRGTTSKSLTIANGAAVTEAFEMSNHAGGSVLMPAAWTAASIGFQIAVTAAGTFYPLYDDSGALVQISSPAVDNAYSIPAAVFGAAWVKLWSQDGSASDENQGAARTIGVILKS
jgi:hypothetical protein